MQSRAWASATLISRFKMLVELIVAFHQEDESAKKTKNQPEFNKLGMALEDGVRFLFEKEMPDGAEQIAGNITSAILTRLRLLGENKIGGERNTSFIFALIDAMHELGSFRKACESEISLLDEKKRGYGLILMTEENFFIKNSEELRSKNPILAWNKQSNYNLYGCGGDGTWQLTSIDKNRLSNADKKELIYARDVGPGVIFVKPQTSLFNALMQGHSQSYAKEAKKKHLQEQAHELELINVVTEEMSTDDDNQEYDGANKDILLIELDNEKPIDLKVELLEKIKSLSVTQKQTVSCVSFFKHAASYYPKTLTTGFALDFLGLSFVLLYFLSKYLGDTLDALIHKDKTGINHEAMLAIVLLISGTTIMSVALAKSIDCTSPQEYVEEEKERLLRI